MSFLRNTPWYGLGCAFLLFSCGAEVCLAQPQFSFQPLPELPGGASEVFNINAPVAIDGGDGVDTIVAVGRSLDADLVNKAVLWTKRVGQPFEIEPLPNPLGNTESEASGVSCAVSFNDIFCSIGGSAVDLNGVPQPVVWLFEDQWPAEGDFDFTAEVPPLPPGYDSGVATAIAIDVAVVSITASGWVAQPGSEVHHAARWRKDLDAGLWTVELLPDFGPGFYSEAHSIVEIMKDGADGKRFIGGHVQPGSGFGHLPCVWEEQDGGGDARTDLPMTPGAYLGSVSRLMEEEGIYYSSAVGYNASIAALADLYRGTLWRRADDGVWGAPLALPPLPDLRDAKASGAAPGTSNSPDGTTVVGHSYIETADGTERATLWEVAPDDSITIYDLNVQTVDLPPDVVLGARPVVGNIDADPEPEAFAVNFNDLESPSIPHAGLLILLCGADCNKNGEDDCIDLYLGTSGDANANGVPDECEPPLFTFAALPELPGGQSVVLGSASAVGGNGPLDVPWDFGGFCGQALDGDGIWKGAVWLFYPGCLPFDGWMLEVLPNPLGDFAAAATTLRIYGTEPVAAFAAGYVSNEEVWNHPAFWVRQAAGNWTAELPTPPPPYDSGAFLASVEGVSGTINHSVAGWVGQSEGPEPHRAVTCDMNTDGGGWDIIWSLLPDYGPGFFSEARCIVTDADGDSDLATVGGSVQTNASPQAPCVWQEHPGGVFELIELPMVPGAYRGEILSLSSLDNDTGAIDFVRFAVGYNASPGDPADLDRAVLYGCAQGVWGDCNGEFDLLELPGLPDAPFGRANSVIAGTSNSTEGVTVVGYTYSELDPSLHKATLWECSGELECNVIDPNHRTVNLPPGVVLSAAAAIAINIDVSTTHSIGGNYTTDMPPGAVAAAGPISGPHGYALNLIVRGNCCGHDDQGQPFCLNISDIQDCRPVYGGQAVADCSECAMSAPDPVEPAVDAEKVRFISFVVPQTSAGTDTALRAELTSLHHPSSPPLGTPDFAAFEGQFRYLNSFSGSTLCVDSATFSTNYRCGQLGCEPEYRDWATALASATNPASPAGTIHVTGDTVVPSSSLTVSHIAATCGAAPAADTCAAASTGLAISTSRWGDVGGGGGAAPDGSANVIDIGLVVDNVKGLATAIPERRAWMKNPANPFNNPVNVIDIGLTVDAVKGLPYPYTIAACP